MESPEMNGSRWVDERLAVLDPEPKWRPDAARALARLHRRERDSHVRRRGWIWAAAAATVSYMALFALPSPRRLRSKALGRNLRHAGGGAKACSRPTGP